MGTTDSKITQILREDNDRKRRIADNKEKIEISHKKERNVKIVKRLATTWLLIVLFGTIYIFTDVLEPILLLKILGGIIAAVLTIFSVAILTTK